MDSTDDLGGPNNMLPSGRQTADVPPKSRTWPYVLLALIVLVGLVGSLLYFNAPSP
jgi:hypothetical protein